MRQLARWAVPDSIPPLARQPDSGDAHWTRGWGAPSRLSTVALTCPSCGQENPQAAAFCLACGGRFAELGTGSQARKTITVLFTDVVGSTALGESLDTEVLTSVMSRYFDRMRGVLRRHGGTVEKFIGDAVVAVFGYPTVHEDDALRAVRAADQMRSELEALNSELAREPGVILQIRTGVNTGQVLIGALAPGSNFAAGDVMNTAARFQQMAAPGEVLLGEVTWRLVRDAVEAEPIEPVSMKGKAEPVPAWRLVRAQPGAEAFPRHFDSSLVGRQVDLDLLAEAFREALTNSTVQLVTIVGEPGMGKTRLVHELRRLVEAQPELTVRWRQGRCLPYGEGITFWALAEIVKAEAGILESDPAERAAAKIDGAVPDSSPEAAWLRQRLRPLVGLEAPQAGREENFAAWRRFLELLAEAEPSVLVFEDIHWADEALLDFLERLVDRAEGVPILVVATARPELFDRAPAWAAGARSGRRVNLSPLSEADTATLISNLLERAVLPSAAKRTLVSRAGGNPLYAEEFIRLLKDRGTLIGDASMQSIDLEAELALPVGVESIIAARLDTLAPDRKRVLQDAAVVGKVFWSGAAAAMGGGDRWEVEAALHELSRRELVRPVRPSSIDGQAEYAFSHDLVRDVCYSQITHPERARRHREAAEWIEGVAGDRIDDRAEILATHFCIALDLVGAARDPPVDEVRQKAVHYLMLSADLSMRMDVEAAERYYAQALERSSENQLERPQILARHAESIAQRGRVAEAAKVFQEAIDALQATGDERTLAAAMVRQSFVLRRVGDAGFRQVMTEAVAILERLGASAELVEALSLDAAMSFPLGDLDRAIGSANRAIGLAAELGLPVPALAIGYRGAARANRGDREGLEDMTYALDLAEAQGLGQDVAILYNDLSEFLGFFDGPRARVEKAQEGVAFARRRGIEDLALWLSYSALEGLVDAGSYEEADALAAELIPRLHQAEDVYLFVFASGTRTRLLTRRGRHIDEAELEAWLTRAVEFAPADMLSGLLASGAAARLILGNPAGALSLLSELEARAASREMPAYGANLPELVRTAIAAGDIPLATRLAGWLKPKHPLHEPAQLTAQGLLAEERGERTDAARMLAEASGLWDRCGLPWEQAQALLGAGRCLLAAGRGPEAENPLRLARGVFASLEATPAVAECDGLLDQVTAAT
jgi:class 3 adenylate cyclase/tetratricopeptide (TPR) repeat protein